LRPLFKKKNFNLLEFMKKVTKMINKKESEYFKINKDLLFRPLQFSRLTLIIFGFVFVVFIIFIALNFIFLIGINKDIKQDFVVLEDTTNKKIEVINNSLNDVVPNAPLAPGQVKESLNSFGDHFSGLAYINQSKTTMSFDENVTAFTFPPVYTYEKISDSDSGSVTGDAGNSTSLAALNLKVANNELYYRGKKLDLPAELKGENILNVSANLIGTRWLIGIVTGGTHDERGYVYFYDPNGNGFTPLINATSAEKITPNFERIGGTISFGGPSADNFLIVYGAYDGRAYYYYKGTLTDVSQFFGLRVSAEGFKPQIISAKNSRGTVFYICSQTAGNLKFVKFWPKKEGELMGALDFSPLIFKGDLGAATASCEIEKASGKGIKVLIKLKNSPEVNGGKLETYRFTDNGFDNSKDRDVVSVDIGQNRGKKIIDAIIPSLEVFSDGVSGEGNMTQNDGDSNGRFDSKFAIFLANTQPLNWEKMKLSQWFRFNSATESLFYKASFKAEPKDADYSPWFDQINQLNYTTI
jgi:hypothetical protein